MRGHARKLHPRFLQNLRGFLHVPFFLQLQHFFCSLAELHSTKFPSAVTTTVGELVAVVGKADAVGFTERVGGAEGAGDADGADVNVGGAVGAHSYTGDGVVISPLLDLVERDPLLDFERDPLLDFERDPLLDLEAPIVGNGDVVGNAVGISSRDPFALFARSLRSPSTASASFPTTSVCRSK